MGSNGLHIGVKSFIGSSLLAKSRGGGLKPSVSDSHPKLTETVSPSRTESVDLSATTRSGLLRPLETIETADIKSETLPTTGEARQDAFTTALEGSTIAHGANDVLVDFGPDLNESPLEDLKPAFLSLLASDLAVSKLPPADPSGILEPPPIVAFDGFVFQPDVEVRVRPDDATPGSIAAPESVSRREGAITALKSAMDGKDVLGFLSPRKIGGPFETGSFRIQGLDGESVILECDRDPREFLPKESEVLKVGSKPDQIANRPGETNGLFRMHRQDFAKHLDSMIVRNP